MFSAPTLTSLLSMSPSLGPELFGFLPGRPDPSSTAAGVGRWTCLVSKSGSDFSSCVTLAKSLVPLYFHMHNTSILRIIFTSTIIAVIPLFSFFKHLAFHIPLVYISLLLMFPKCLFFYTIPLLNEFWVMRENKYVSSVLFKPEARSGSQF